jgi:hypothetical protein
VTSKLVTFSLISLYQGGPSCQLYLPPRAGRPWLRRHRILLRPATARRPASRLEWLPHALTRPTINLLLNPPLNLAVFSGLKNINATVTPPPRHPSLALPPAPIKGKDHPRTSLHLFPSLPSPLAPSFTLAMS